MRSKYGTKRSDFCIMEQEGCDWIGSHKLCGENNDVTESSRCIEIFYDRNVTNADCEGICCNSFNTMTDGGNVMSNDELKLTPNKGCVMSIFFRV